MSNTLPDLGSAESLAERRYWWQYLNGTQWSVLILCALGWMFDCADQQIFTASRAIAMRDLLPGATMQHQNEVGSWATALFMIGWATGGLIFGVIGDKWGRAKTMALTIFLYAAFTGLSAISRTWQEFALSRFLTGFGVGGEFAAGAALVADVMPQQARAQALGWLQALSAVGNVLGAMMLGVTSTWAHGNEHYSWRYLYLVGALPALLAVFAMSYMREPEKWRQAKRAAAETGGRAMGRISDLFTDARWRRNTFVGLALAISGVVGLWGIGFYSPELIDASFPQMSVETGRHLQAAMAINRDDARSATIAALDKPDQQAYKRLLARTASHGENLLPDLATVPLTSARRATIAGLLSRRMTPEAAAQLKSRALMLQQVGAFLGMLAFAWLATRIGRRLSFMIAFVAAWSAIAVVFLSFHSPVQVWYLYPLLGFCTLLPFGGYAIYFPELFPTRLRTTGTGFCYNVGRYVASLGPLAFGSVGAALAGRYEIQGFRLAAVLVASIYLVGIIAAFVGPETMDQPLPEDQVAVAH
jgi:MFS family permease